MADSPIRDDRMSFLLVRAMAQQCVRNTALEDLHAGPMPLTRTGDWSDVTVVDAEGRHIPWPEVSHFGDDAMRELMREIVDNLYTFLLLSREPGFLVLATVRKGVYLLARNGRFVRLASSVAWVRADSFHLGSYPHAVKKLRASCGVTASMASRIASQSVWTERAAAFFRRALILEKAISMGLKSGL